MAELDIVNLEDDSLDKDSPFHKDNAPGLNLIVLMRIYDVQMAILNKMDPDTADRVYDAHEAGKVINVLPHYTGAFGE